MTTTHEHAMRRPNAYQTADWTWPTPNTDPITPYTPNDQNPPALTHQRHLLSAHTTEHAR